jgi:hypothetical protein
MRCGPGLVQLFLKERQSLQPHTAPSTWGGPSWNIRPRENRISRPQALQGGPNRFAINELGLCIAPARKETAGVAMPVRSFGAMGTVLVEGRPLGIPGGRLNESHLRVAWFLD